MRTSSSATSVQRPLFHTITGLPSHKLLGRQAARTVIVAAAVINLCMAGYFLFLSWLPADASWELQAAFAAVLSPAWRIVLASIAAEVVHPVLGRTIVELLADAEVGK